MAAALFLLSGCRPIAAALPTSAPTKTTTSAFTKAPTKTSALTDTPTATNTPTTTPTLTETPAYNLPGTYYFYKCINFQPAGIPVGATVDFCITSVNVNEDRTMQFNVYWKLHNEFYSGAIIKGSDFGNQNMFLYDNLKNEYQAVGWGGSAATRDIMTTKPSAGWFLFPAAKPGATTFRFYDFDNKFYIDDIVLLAKTGTDTPTFTPTRPSGTPYNEPGTYNIYRCITHPPSGRLLGAEKVRLCLNTIVVNADRTMKFNMTWQIFTTVGVTKDSDADNANIFLLDNLENEYHHIAVGGCAAQVRYTKVTEICGGWFLFSAAQPGATSFRYVDLGNLISFDDIVLVPEEM